jgi:hypothetical protein
MADVSLFVLSEEGIMESVRDTSKSKIEMLDGVWAGSWDRRPPVLCLHRLEKADSGWK